MSALNSRFSALRATVRYARRDAARNRGRSALIAVMVALPVLAAGTVSVIYRSDQRDAQDTVRAVLGDQAQARLTYQPGRRIDQDPAGQSIGSMEDAKVPRFDSEPEVRAAVQGLLSDRNELVTDVQMFAPGAIRIGDHRTAASIREFNYTASGLEGIVTQVSGRAPAATGEVAVSAELSRRYDTKLGDTLDLALDAQFPVRKLTVVGVVASANLSGSNLVLGRPGDLIPAALISFDPESGGQIESGWLVTGPDPIPWEQVLALNRIGVSVTSRAVLLNPPAEATSGAGDYTPNAADAGIIAVVIALGLLQIALLAGPAIAVGARRNQRGLAIMVSTGAEPRHLRAVVIASSGVIGLVASGVAAVLGGALGAGIVAWMMRTGRGTYPRVDLHLLDLVGLAAVGTLTAVAAALIPAWQAARLDVVAVLTGRRRLLPTRTRVPLAGLLVAASGIGLAYLFSGREQQFPAVAALALAEVGLIVATGALLVLVARLARWLPFSGRFALRDAARQRGRTVPAIAAVLAAVAGASCALVFVASQAAHDEKFYTPEARPGATRVHFSGLALAESDMDAVESAVRETLPVDEIVRVRSQSETTESGYTESIVARSPPQNECPAFDETGEPQRTENDPRCTGHGSVQFAPVFDDGTAYPVLTGDRDSRAAEALRAGRAAVNDPLLLWPDGTVHVVVGDEEGKKERTVVLPATLGKAADKFHPVVYPLSSAKALGAVVEVGGFAVTTTRLPTRAEEKAANYAVEDVLGGGWVTVEQGYEDDYAIGLLALVVAAMVVALGGTFAAVGLAAAESRADVATLAAVGASPGIRRRLAGSQAGVIAGLGSLLGVFSGGLAGWFLVRLERRRWSDPVQTYWQEEGLEQFPLVLPWTHLLVVGLGLPLLAIAVGYLTTRSRLPLVRRLGQ